MYLAGAEVLQHFPFFRILFGSLILLFVLLFHFSISITYLIIDFFLTRSQYKVLGLRAKDKESFLNKCGTIRKKNSF